MSYSENNSFEQIMERNLSKTVFDELDKRPGSIIYDSLAPMAMELADAYVTMDILQEQTYLMSASGENLDKRCYDFGIKRILATQAKRIGSFKTYKLDEQGNPEKDEFGKKILIDMDIPVGSRFTVPENSDITYVYIGVENENKILVCEQYGTIGNSYNGIILPIVAVKDLIECKIVGTYQPARDVELDTDLRERTKESINHRAFGGNIPDYIESVKHIDGAGTCKVFPAWQYNGSVLLSVVDAQFNPASMEFQALIKKELDPEELTGQGRGIAPIGHYVTVTAPTKKMVKIEIKVDLKAEVTIGTVREDINREIEKYFNSVRHQFGQDNILAIYKARVIDAVLNVSDVLNVKSVLLDDDSEDIIYKDEPFIGKQYLPYVKEVIIG